MKNENIVLLFFSKHRFNTHTNGNLFLPLLTLLPRREKKSFSILCFRFFFTEIHHLFSVYFWHFLGNFFVTLIQVKCISTRKWAPIDECLCVTRIFSVSPIVWIVWLCVCLFSWNARFFYAHNNNNQVQTDFFVDCLKKRRTFNEKLKKKNDILSNINLREIAEWTGNRVYQNTIKWEMEVNTK